MRLKSSQIFKRNAFSWLKTLFVLIFSGFTAILRNISYTIDKDRYWWEERDKYRLYNREKDSIESNGETN